MKDSPGIHLPPPFLFVVGLIGGVAIDGNVLQWRHVLHASQWIGVAVGVAGLALIGLTLALFASHRTRPEPWEPATNLIEVGPYRLSRNPMYLGMAVTSAGIAIFFESVVAMVLLGLVVVIIDRWVIAREEAYLARQFGDEFEAYRKRVRRWI